MSQRISLHRCMTENAFSTEAVNQCVKFLVCREGSKTPIKLAEISNHLTQFLETTNDSHSKIVLLIIEKAKIVLKSVYGYKLVKTGKKGPYIMVLSEELPNTSETLTSTYSEPHHRKLLIAALTHIFMSGGTIKDTDMWNFLAKTKLMEERDMESRKIITHTFCKQLYLEYKVEHKVGPPENATHEFCWGPRAEAELPKNFILNKMAIAFGKAPSYWKEQFESSHTNGNVPQ